jgi:hypothetical protein
MLKMAPLVFYDAINHSPCNAVAWSEYLSRPTAALQQCNRAYPSLSSALLRIGSVVGVSVRSEETHTANLALLASSYYPVGMILRRGDYSD